MFMWFCWQYIHLLDSIAKCNMAAWQCLEPKATCFDAIDLFLWAPFAVGCDSAAKQGGRRQKNIEDLVWSIQIWGMVWGCCCKSCLKLKGFYPKKSLGHRKQLRLCPPNVQPTRQLKVSNRKVSNHHPNLCTISPIKKHRYYRHT